MRFLFKCNLLIHHKVIREQKCLSSRCVNRVLRAGLLMCPQSSNGALPAYYDTTAAGSSRHTSPPHLHIMQDHPINLDNRQIRELLTFSSHVCRITVHYENSLTSMLISIIYAKTPFLDIMCRVPGAVPGARPGRAARCERTPSVMASRGLARWRRATRKMYRHYLQASRFPLSIDFYQREKNVLRTVSLFTVKDLAKDLLVFRL